MATSDEERRHHVHPALLARAREFRRPLTPAEKKVWAGVRGQQLGCKVRRQHAIWHFIADLYCHAAQLVIEIDGDTHAAADQAAYDAARTEWLEARGYRVIRFHNEEVHRNLPGVLASIQAACRERISATPEEPAKHHSSPRSKAPSPAGRGMG